MKHCVRYGLILILCLFVPVSCGIGMHPQIGWFPESSFDLSTNSRIPKWFNIPKGYKRTDLSVKSYYFSPPSFIPFMSKENFKVVLIGSPPNNIILETKYGIKRPYLLSATKGNGYPVLYTIDIEGVVETIEHKKMEPVFYITD